MKKLVTLIFGFRLRELLVTPTEDLTIQAFRGLCVGGAAFVADAGLMWVLTLTGLHYLICAALSFVVGVVVNYILSKAFVFTGQANMGKAGEMTVYLVVSLVGLGLTEVLLWLFTDIVGFYVMASKCIAALIAFAWNFTARKLIIYTKRG